MLALANGRFGQAADLCTRWESLFPDRPHEFAPSASLLAAKVGTGEFSEDSAQEVLEIASSIQRAKRSEGLPGHSFGMTLKIHLASCTNDACSRRPHKQPNE